jgi:hypothetical protein
LGEWDLDVHVNEWMVEGWWMKKKPCSISPVRHLGVIAAAFGEIAKTGGPRGDDDGSDDDDIESLHPIT